MSSHRVAVYEQQHWWVPELQRQFAECRVSVRGCRTLRDLLEAGSESVRPVIVLDFESGAATCLQFLGRRLRLPDPPPVITISGRRTAVLEWSIRELGSTAFLGERPDGSVLAAYCRRMWSGEPGAIASMP